MRERAYFISQRTATKCRIHSICTARGSHITAERPLHKAGREALFRPDSGLYELYQSLDELTTHVTRLEAQIQDVVTSTRPYEILLSLPGVGPVTAAAVLAEVGDFARFPRPAALISYAGLYPKERSSGERRHTGGMCKAGSKVLRYAIVEAAMRIRDTARSRNLYTHYQVARTVRHKTPKQARVVVAHKLLTIAWYLVHRNCEYDDRAVRPAQREMTS